MQQRYGYPDSLRSTDNEIWGKLRKRFLRRLRHLQKHKLTLRSPYRSSSVCPCCDKTWPMEHQYVHGRFCWTTTFRHHVRVHEEYVAPTFWFYVMLVTQDDVPASKYESKVMKAYAGKQVETDAREHHDFYVRGQSKPKRKR